MLASRRFCANRQPKQARWGFFWCVMPSQYLLLTTKSMLTKRDELNELLSGSEFDHTVSAMLDGINLWIASADNLDPKIRIDAACDIVKEHPNFLDRRKDQIPTSPGCYCFYTDNSIFYVGTSENMRQRVAGRFPQCSYVAVIECENDFRHQLECHLISSLKPVKNAETRNRWEVE